MRTHSHDEVHGAAEEAWQESRAEPPKQIMPMSLTKKMACVCTEFDARAAPAHTRGNGVPHKLLCREIDRRCSTW